MPDTSSSISRLLRLGTMVVVLWSLAVLVLAAQTPVAATPPTPSSPPGSSTDPASPTSTDDGQTAAGLQPSPDGESDDAVGAAVPALYRAPVAVSNTGHLWYLERYAIDTGEPGKVLYRVVHQGPNMAEDASQAATLIRTLPQAMVAIDRTLYFIFPPSTPAEAAAVLADESGLSTPPATASEDPADASPRASLGGRSRTVTSVRADWNPAVTRWIYSPRGRTAIVESLPGEGELLSVAPGYDSPLVLLRMASQTPSDPTVEGSDSSPAARELSGARPTELRLLQLRLNQWKEVPLPEDLPDRSAFFALFAGAQPMLAAQPVEPNEGNQPPTGSSVFPPVTVWPLDFDQKERLDPVWSHSSEIRGLDAWLWQVESAIPFMGQTMIATGAVTAPHTLRLSMIQEGRAYRVGKASGLGDARVFVNYRGLPALISLLVGGPAGESAAPGVSSAAEPAEEPASVSPGAQPVGANLDLEEDETVLNVRIIDYTTGETTQQFTIGRRMAPGADQFSPLALMLVLLLAFFVMFLFRPEQVGAVVTLPAGVVLADPSRRFMATVLDLIPSALLVMVTMGVRPSELLEWPLFSRQIQEALPALIMIILTVAHSTLTEMISARTLGKMMLSERVISLDGSRPRPAQILVRNLMKFVVLLIPPVALLMFLSPLRQRLGDLAARTLVIVEIDGSDSDEAAETGPGPADGREDDRLPERRADGREPDDPA